MKLPKPETHEFELCPAGNHLAVCFQLVDLGTQKTNYLGQVKHQHKIRIAWEIPDELMEDGRPFMISNEYTFSMYDKAKLRHHLESWRGRPFVESDFETFDLKNILGTACLLNVVHNKSENGKTYANISAVAALPKGTTKPNQLVNAILYFSFDEPAANVFDSMPEWMQQKIAQSPEYQAWQNPGESQEVADDQNQEVNYQDDEIPF